MPAFAQDLAQGSAPPAAEQTAPGVTGVEDILVTATKRNENLIDVPISMSVLTETAITSAGIDRASEFRSEEHTSELQSQMRISYAVLCLQKKKKKNKIKDKKPIYKTEN